MIGDWWIGKSGHDNSLSTRHSLSSWAAKTAKDPTSGYALS